jgi:hypothetical protein
MPMAPVVAPVVVLVMVLPMRAHDRTMGGVTRVPMLTADTPDHRLVMMPPVRRTVPVIVIGDHVTHDRARDERQRCVLVIGPGGQRNRRQAQHHRTDAQQNERALLHVSAPLDDRHGQACCPSTEPVLNPACTEAERTIPAASS